MKQLIWLVIWVLILSGSSCEKKLPVVDEPALAFQNYSHPAIFSSEESDTLLAYYFTGAGDPYNKSGIYLYDINQREEKLLFVQIYAGGMDFSPDGKWLVLSVNDIIWKTPLDGDTVIFLAADEYGGGCYFPDWSPDGQKIAYDIPGGPNGGIWIMDPDGKNQQKIVVGGRDPAWSPDGNRLYYEKYTDSVWTDTISMEIYYYDFVTGQEKRLTYLRHEYTSEPSVSSSGEMVVFTSDEGRKSLPQIWIMGKNGENPKQITSQGGCDPVFYSEDKILYVKVKWGDGRLWIMGVDGTNDKLFF
jgi:Tol biopolymer transport system component